MSLFDVLMFGAATGLGYFVVEWLVRRLGNENLSPPMRIVYTDGEGNKQTIDVPPLRPGESHKSEVTFGEAAGGTRSVSRP